MVDNDKISRIIARREEKFNERIEALARAVQADNQRKMILKKTKKIIIEPYRVIKCPRCSNPMMRKFYSLVYLIEIDSCGMCNITWLDSNELEMLQCVVENKINGYNAIISEM